LVVNDFLRHNNTTMEYSRVKGVLIEQLALNRAAISVVNMAISSRS